MSLSFVVRFRPVLVAVAFCLTVPLASHTAQAVPLVDAGASTYDPNTGLEWLDLSPTSGQSVASVLGGFGGYIGAGYRVAEFSEVAAFLINGGMTSVSYPAGFYPADLTDAVALVTLLGPTYSTPSYVASQGWAYTDVTHAFLRDPFVAYTIGESTDTGIACGCGYLTSSLSAAFPELGVWLVREAGPELTRIPEPTSLGVFAIGLLGLCILRRRGRGFHAIGAVSLALALGMTANNANAVPVTLNATNNVEIQVHFTAPAQPVAHNAIQVGPLTYTTLPGGFVDQAALYENGVLLATGSFANFPGGRFADFSSFFAPTSHAVFDFSAIAGGVTDGMITFSIIYGAGQVLFDTANLLVTTFGDSGGAPSFQPTITHVDVVTRIPEPTSLGVLAVGLLGLALIRRRGNPLRSVGSMASNPMPPAE